MRRYYRHFIIAFLLGCLPTSYAYNFIVDTDPSNGFGNIDAARSVIEGQTFQVDVYLEREAGDPDVDAYGITLEFNDLDAVLSLQATDPVRAHGNAPGADKYALDGTTITDPYDLDPEFGFIGGGPSLGTGSAGLFPLVNSGNNSPSAIGVNGHVFTENTGGEGVFSGNATPFSFGIGDMILLEAILFSADLPGVTQLGVAGIFNPTAALGDTSNAPGAAFANVGEIANTYALFNSAGSGTERIPLATFVNGQITVNAIPEASSLTLLGLGLIGFYFRRFRYLRG